MEKSVILEDLKKISDVYFEKKKTISAQVKSIELWMLSKIILEKLITQKKMKLKVILTIE